VNSRAEDTSVRMPRSWPREDGISFDLLVTGNITLAGVASLDSRGACESLVRLYCACTTLAAAFLP
jgi:hypothetical protein